MSKYLYLSENTEFQIMPIGDVKQRPDNPRINDDSVQELVEAIKQDGFRDPIEVDDKNVIVVGDARLKAAKILKMTHVPVVKYKDLKNDVQAMVYCIRNNDPKLQGKYDKKQLAKMTAAPEFKPFNLGFSFTPPEKKEEDKEKTLTLWFEVNDRRLFEVFSVKFGLKKGELDLGFVLPAFLHFFGKPNGKRGQLDGKKALTALIEYEKTLKPVTKKGK